jgi:hypothetical protein
VKCCWVYQTKFIFEGVIELHKEFLVSNGFSQQEDIVYNETFSPVLKMNYVRLIISLASHFEWKIHHMDVKTSLLHGNLSKKYFMEQALSFVTDSNLVCQLKKFLYRLKQGPQDLYANIDNLFLRLGFKHCESD